MEVILNELKNAMQSLNFLHVCGGDPIAITLSIYAHLFSPRMWRWSDFTGGTKATNTIFSTYVEVILM